MGTGGKVAVGAAAATGAAIGINAIRKKLKQRKMAQQQNQQPNNNFQQPNNNYYHN